MKFFGNRKFLLIVAVAGILGLMALSGCGSKESGSPKAEATTVQKSNAAKTGEKSKTKSKRKIKYWQAPMNPTEIYDHPGKSSMGMDLIPVYQDESQNTEGLVSIDPVTEQNMGVRTGIVKRMDFTRIIRTVGKVNYDEEKLYTITTKISGWIEKLFVNFTGEIIKKGQPLLEIYSPDLVTTQQEYLLALNTQRMVSKSQFQSIREGGESLLESTLKRLKYWDVPEAEIKRLEKTGKVRKTIMLKSPANGMVINSTVVEGAHIKEGMNLMQIADLSDVWVHVSIYDYELPWIRQGEKAEMELSYLPGKVFHGRVSYIYPYLREQARDAHVRLEFKNPNLELKPGMYVNVRLRGATIHNALVIPSEAVIRSGQRNIVFVERGKGKFQPKEVELGAEGGDKYDYIQVLSGLQEGERIVTSAQFMLDSESRLQEAISKMLEQKKKAKMEGNSVPGIKMDSGKKK